MFVAVKLISRFIIPMNRFFPATEYDAEVMVARAVRLEQMCRRDEIPAFETNDDRKSFVFRLGSVCGSDESCLTQDWSEGF